MITLARMLICAAAVLAAGSLVAEPTTLEQLREELAEKSGTVDTYMADMDTSMNMGGMAMNYTGHVRGKGDMNVTTMTMDMLGNRIETRTVLDADGIAWTEMDMMGMKQVMKMDMSGMEDMMEGMGMSNPFGGMMGGNMGQASNPMNVLNTYRHMYDLEFAGRETLNGEEVYVVGGSLNQEARDSFAEMNEMIQGATADAGAGAGMNLDFLAMMDSVRVALGADDGFPREVQILMPDGTAVTSIRYSNVQLNVPLEDALFEYSPPEGVEVMDLSNVDLDDMASAGAGGGSDYNALLQVGDEAPLFEAATLSGETLALEDYRGNIVLLDFWASWCGPCIAELPNLIETYEAFEPLGLKLIGISLDDERAAVESFLAKRPAMTWPQVFDGKGWGSEVGELYGVDAIPFVLLLDSEGTIIARDLHGDALKEKLTELLGDPSK